MSTVKSSMLVAAIQIREATADALSDVTEFLLEEANRTVPIEEGTLARSGVATVDRQNLRGVVSYDTPYAVAQHEHEEYQHDPGRRARWLMLTFREQSARVLGYLADGVKRGFR